MLPLTKFFYATLLASSVYAAPLIRRDAANNMNLIEDLVLAATAVDRIKGLLADDPKNFVFNFVANVNKTGAGNGFPVCKHEKPTNLHRWPNCSREKGCVSSYHWNRRFSIHGLH